MNVTDDPPASFCLVCGQPMERAVPEGDDRRRDICRNCGYIHYRNPKLVAGAIVESGGGILMCRRAIEPAYGKWTLPAGFLENGETVAECACRETWEEARARMEKLEPYAMASLPEISQVYFIFRASLVGSFAPGRESLETVLMEPAKIPWEELAFTSIRTVLHHYLEDLKTGSFRFRSLDIPI